MTPAGRVSVALEAMDAAMRGLRELRDDLFSQQAAPSGASAPAERFESVDAVMRALSGSGLAADTAVVDLLGDIAESCKSDDPLDEDARLHISIGMMAALEEAARTAASMLRRVSRTSNG